MVKWNIGTFARIRPPRRNHDCTKFLLEKLENGTQSAARISYPPPSEGDDVGFSMKQREMLQFQYSNIFDPGVSQEEIFNNVCLEIVQSALDGYNGTILAYGQTGSGKTYTITGGEHYADRGIIPRVLSTIFEEFEKRASTVKYACFVSYLEIYNENVYDLLDRSHTDRPIEEWTKVLLLDDDDGEMHFRNLGVYEAVSEEEALNLLFLGNMNRVTSDTPMNQASSRSHSVFSVMIEARPIDSEVIVTSKLHLVDLAGSERVYKRQGTQRMRTEGKHINLSLHHLEQVILSLRHTTQNSKTKSTMAKSFHVPYRNSMLTSVLRGSLGGNCKSVFIATLNPESEFTDESISTCRFMQRCSEVSVEIAVNSEVDVEKRLLALEKAKDELVAVNGALAAKVGELETQLEIAQQVAKSYDEEKDEWQREKAELQSTLAHVQQQHHHQQQQMRGSVVDWSVCEELVEKLLLTGDVPRSVVDPDEDEEDDEEDEERREARQLFLETAEEIRQLGVASAIGCLTVMRESTVFASNTAAELQEMMDTQKQTVLLLEKRLHEQKQDADQLKSHLKQLQHRQSTKPQSTGGARSATGSSTHSQSQSQSHRSGHSTSGGPSGSSSAAQSESDANESDSDLDSEAPDSKQYVHPHAKSHPSGGALGAATPPTTMSLVFHNGAASRTSSNDGGGGGGGPAPVAPLPPASTSSTHDSLATSPLAPPAPQPPLKSGSDMIRRRMDLLKNGSLFVKYGRFGKPHVRFVWCSTDLEYLHYRKASASIAKASIPTRNMQKVLLGQHTKVFERAKQTSRDPFCFSIEYEEGNARTLDLEITDGEGGDQKKIKRSEWVDALQFLLKLKAAQQKKKPLVTAPVAATGPIQ